MRKFITVDVDRSEETTKGIRITIDGSGLTLDDLREFYDFTNSLEDFVVDEPIIREFEDPALMAELDRRIEEAEAGNTIPWDGVKKKLKDGLN